MNKRIVAVLFAVCALPALSVSASAQNPCAEIGSDCRVMTAAEVQAFKALVLTVKRVLPVPDPARYRHNGAAEGSTTPFVAEANSSEAVPTCRAWPAGSIPESPYNTLLFGYDAKAKPGETKKDQKDPLAATQAMMSAFESRVEVSVELFPHAFS